MRGFETERKNRPDKQNRPLMSPSTVDEGQIQRKEPGRASSGQLKSNIEETKNEKERNLRTVKEEERFASCTTKEQNQYQIENEYIPNFNKSQPFVRGHKTGRLTNENYPNSSEHTVSHQLEDQERVQMKALDSSSPSHLNDILTHSENGMKTFELSPWVLSTSEDEESKTHLIPGNQENNAIPDPGPILPNEEHKFDPPKFIFDAFRLESMELVKFIEDINESVPIPKLAVVGDQYSGKSSILEAISGIPFVRGDKSRIKCPIIVTLMNGAKWRASFSICNGPTCHVLNEDEQNKIPAILKELSAKLTGPSKKEKRIQSDPSIEIFITAPNMPALTMIDLPGIVPGNTLGQGWDEMEKVDKMIHRYLEPSDTVILAVVPACLEFDSVEVLKRLQRLKIDSSDVRTIGVITKPDLISISHEDEVKELLKNRRVQLYNEYYLVMNPSQNDLSLNISHQDARENEQEWIRFSTFSWEKKLWESRLGTNALVFKLAELLTQRVEFVFNDRNVLIN